MNRLVLIALKRLYIFVALAMLVVPVEHRRDLEYLTDAFSNSLISVTSVAWTYDGLLPVGKNQKHPKVPRREGGLSARNGGR